MLRRYKREAKVSLSIASMAVPPTSAVSSNTRKIVTVSVKQPKNQS